MADSTCDNPVWDFAHPVARFRGDPWSAQVDVSRPQVGLYLLRCGAEALDGQLLSVAPSGTTAWPAKVADAYVRGSDLVAAYEPTADWPYAPQLYWRADSPRGKTANGLPAVGSDDGVRASLSLLVSIQTDLLDTHPLVDVASCLPSDEVLGLAISDRGEVHAESFIGGERTIHPRADVCCVLRRLPGGELSCAEIMLASDFRQLSVHFQSAPAAAGAGECRTRWGLFAEFLEKGVIRRARLQLAILNRDEDVHLAAACGRALAQRPLPLTT